jgi:hypothetical protein
MRLRVAVSRRRDQERRAPIPQPIARLTRQPLLASQRGTEGSNPSLSSGESANPPVPLGRVAEPETASPPIARKLAARAILELVPIDRERRNPVSVPANSGGSITEREGTLKASEVADDRCCPYSGIAAGEGQMPVIAKRRQIDKGDRRARTGAIGLEHCMREARFKMVVVHRVEPDLRQEVAFAKPADGGDKAFAPAADLAGGSSPRRRQN